MEQLVMVLIWLVIIAVVAAFAWWAINYWEVLELIKKILVFAMIVAVVLAVIILLAGLVGGMSFPRLK